MLQRVCEQRDPTALDQLIVGRFPEVDGTRFLDEVADVVPTTALFRKWDLAGSLLRAFLDEDFPEERRADIAASPA